MADTWLTAEEGVMSDPTPEEIEAAARALGKHFLVNNGNCACGWTPNGGSIGEAWRRFRRHQARAALTAAAQVREERRRQSLVEMWAASVTEEVVNGE